MEMQFSFLFLFILFWEVMHCSGVCKRNFGVSIQYLAEYVEMLYTTVAFKNQMSICRESHDIISR